MTTIVKQPDLPATHAMIWMHGLGASNKDMAGLVDALNLPELPLRHICLQAPSRAVTINAGIKMPAWYDIVGDKLNDREDKVGILASDRLIHAAIEEQEGQGISSSKIFLAGFSQGGAMALYSALHHQKYLAGVVSLSSYLPLASECMPKQRKTLPIFMAYGAMDPVVLPQWTKMSAGKLIGDGFSRIQQKEYPMMHEVTLQEIADLRQWILGRMA